MKQYPPESSWNFPPTPRQVRRMVLLGVQDDAMPKTRWEAREVIYRLLGERRRSSKIKKGGSINNGKR